MTEDQIEHMVDRFLNWRLPENFAPDAGISYRRPNYAPEVDATPTGTNLFDAYQATAMVRHMVEDLPVDGPAASLRAENARLRAVLTQILQAAVLSNHQAPPEGARHCPLCIAVSVARAALAPQEERKDG